MTDDIWRRQSDEKGGRPLRRQVALKILSAELSASDTSLRRFKTEAELVARATHANIVQIYAVGQVGNVNFMALEYVEGRNLRDFVEKRKPIDLATGLKIMAQVAAALQRARVRAARRAAALWRVAWREARRSLGRGSAATRS